MSFGVTVFCNCIVIICAHLDTLRVCVYIRLTLSMPAKWLCDASSVLVGVWLFVTLRFQPSPLASKLLAALRKGEQSVSLSLPVHSLSTASPMQCLLVAAGVYGCCKAPEPNCKGEISMTQG